MRDEVSARWEGAVLVCGKCSKRAGVPLAKKLRKAMGEPKGRKARVGVVETRCLGLCPKRGVVVVDTRAPGRWRIVAGDDVAGLADSLKVDRALSSRCGAG